MADIYELEAEQLTASRASARSPPATCSQAIERSKEQPFHRVLYGLGIPGIGYVNARALTGQFRSMDALMAATPEEIEKTPGIGPVLADDDRRDALRGRTRELIERLRGHG